MLNSIPSGISFKEGNLVVYKTAVVSTMRNFCQVGILVMQVIQRGLYRITCLFLRILITPALPISQWVTFTTTLKFTLGSTFIPEGYQQAYSYSNYWDVYQKTSNRRRRITPISIYCHW